MGTTRLTATSRRRILNGLIPLILASVSCGLLLLTLITKRIYKAVKRSRRRRRLHAIVGYSSAQRQSHIPPSGHVQSSSHLHSSDAFANHSRFSSAGGNSDDGGSTNSGGNGTLSAPLPQVIIETEAEHEMHNSHDLMLEAENAVIRAQVKQQGIVWPGAFKALGMLKQKENHHHPKPAIKYSSKYLAVPGDGLMHDSDSWIQWWKAPRKKMKKKMNWLRGIDSKRHGRKSRRRKWTWKELGDKLLQNGKKDFIQALLAWAIVATVFSKSIFMRDIHTGWNWVAGIAWVSEVLSALLI